MCGDVPITRSNIHCVCQCHMRRQTNWVMIPTSVLQIITVYRSTQTVSTTSEMTHHTQQPAA